MENLFDYTGRRCLFTGCASGMGEAGARIVSSLGGRVVAVDVKKPGGFDYEAFHEVDLRDPAAIDQMLAEVSDDGPIDRLFYCAGLPGTAPALDVMLVNFLGLRHCVEQALTHMPGDGAIVTISSAGGMGYVAMMDKIMPLLHEAGHAEGKRWIEAHQGEDWFEPYSFSKACTIAYTLWRGANLTSETGIRLNAISPGPTDTPMMPSFIEHAGAKFMAAYPRSVGRNSTAEEQGWPLAFLNSNAASYISGENLYTDAGTAGGLMTGAVTLDASLMGK